MSAPAQPIPPDVLLTELGIESPADIDIEAIAQYCGATITYAPLTGSEARLIGFDGRAIITVNSASSVERQRFSAAHELGHWMYDRGKIAFECADKQLVSEWGAINPEQRANRYAAQLLLPKSLFKERAQNREITFATVKALAEEFRTSLTATAIRLIELTEFPAIILCSNASGRVWFSRSKIVPESIWPIEKLHTESLAFKLHSGVAVSASPKSQTADVWINADRSEEYYIQEESIRTTTGLVISLLWWKNERQILDTMKSEDRSW